MDPLKEAWWDGFYTGLVVVVLGIATIILLIVSIR